MNVLNSVKPVNGTVAFGTVATVTWDLTAMGSPVLKFLNYQQVTGCCFWIAYTKGDATSVVVNIYTSFRASGDDSDWAIFAPDNPITHVATDYNLTMPATTKTWVTPKLELPEGTKRVQMRIAFIGGTPNDVVNPDLIPTTR